MWSSETDSETGRVLRQIAGALAAKIAPEAAYPAIFKSFPVDGKVPHTEAYITSNYIGHEFLKGVYVVRYRISGREFQVFAIDGRTQSGARSILEKYFTFTGQSLDFQEGSLLAEDRYNGSLPLVWKGRYITGVFSEDGQPFEGAVAFLTALAGRL
jgi:hypothetical protein